MRETSTINFPTSTLPKVVRVADDDQKVAEIFFVGIIPATMLASN